MGQNSSLKSPGTLLSQATQYPHIFVPKSYVLTMPFSYGQSALSIQPLFQMPDNIARLYIEILKYKRKIIKVERGIKFITIYLSPPKKEAKGHQRLFRNKMFDPVILGNIFD